MWHDRQWTASPRVFIATSIPSDNYFARGWDLCEVQWSACLYNLCLSVRSHIFKPHVQMIPNFTNFLLLVAVAWSSDHNAAVAHVTDVLPFDRPTAGCSTVHLLIYRFHSTPVGHGRIHSLKNWGTNYGEKRPYEACKGIDRWGVGRCPPPHMPPPKNFLKIFWAQNCKFWCILGANFIAIEVTTCLGGIIKSQ